MRFCNQWSAGVVSIISGCGKLKSVTATPSWRKPSMIATKLTHASVIATPCNMSLAPNSTSAKHRVVAQCLGQPQQAIAGGHSGHTKIGQRYFKPCGKSGWIGGIGQRASRVKRYDLAARTETEGKARTQRDYRLPFAPLDRGLLGGREWVVIAAIVASRKQEQHDSAAVPDGPSFHTEFPLSRTIRAQEASMRASSIFQSSNNRRIQTQARDTASC